MPVFFIRDGISFPDMVHALKPNPRNHIQGACLSNAGVQNPKVALMNRDCSCGVDNLFSPLRYSESIGEPSALFSGVFTGVCSSAAATMLTVAQHRQRSTSLLACCRMVANLGLLLSPSGGVPHVHIPAG